MKKIILKYMKQEERFTNFFIKRNKNYLMSFNPKTYQDKDFKFYIGWFIFAINDEMNDKQFNLIPMMIELFLSNNNLNIIYFPYIISKNFRELVKNEITFYKKYYDKSSIYE